MITNVLPRFLSTTVYKQKKTVSPSTTFKF